jgi:hypothetical protein
MRQKDNALFATSLNLIREGKQIKQDMDMLIAKLNENENRSEHIHLFSSNALVDDHNIIKSGKSSTSVALDYAVGNFPASSKMAVLSIARDLEPQNSRINPVFL